MDRAAGEQFNSTSTPSYMGRRSGSRRPSTCPRGSKHDKPAFTFFGEDSATHNLVYTNADLFKANQNNDIISFCDHNGRHLRLGCSNPAAALKPERVRQTELAELARLAHTTRARRLMVFGNHSGRPPTGVTLGSHRQLLI